MENALRTMQQITKQVLGEGAKKFINFKTKTKSKGKKK